MEISNQLEENIDRLENILIDCADVVRRRLSIAEVDAYLMYVDSMIDRELIEGDFLNPSKATSHVPPRRSPHSMVLQVSLVARALCVSQFLICEPNASAYFSLLVPT